MARRDSVFRTRTALSKFKLTGSEVKLPRRPSLPKVERRPIFGRAPAGLSETLKAAENVSGPGPVPATGPLALATKPEWYCYWALERLGKRSGIDFNYRGEVQFLSSLAAAAQLDFTMIDGTQIAMEIQGIHWHYELGAEKIVQDLVRRAELVSSGWTVIFIDEDDALRNPIFYVREALAGREHSYFTAPVFVRPWL